MTTPARYQSANELFLAACDLNPEEQHALLNAYRSSDLELWTLVDAMLRKDAQAGTFLEAAALPMPDPDTTSPLVSGGAHDSRRRIGSYRILRTLGEGGMGTVYEAEQATTNRRVALKVIKGGPFVTKSDVNLFRREIQTLGRLKHPGIGQIYEAGRTEHGQHYFAMELLEGEPITDCVGNNELSVRERLRLFGQICEAVQYAHERGVIHRDLKPANILVIDAPSSRGGSADSALQSQVKILDFGLARITDIDASVTISATHVGRVMGTLAYMSPEQAAGRTDDLDIRTDIYALGVLLYKLLTGRLPYALPDISLLAAAQVIQDHPPLPPSKIDRSLRGDLEVIVLKSLEKDKRRRYESVAALSQDLERFLDRQPITARSPGFFYRLGKFVRRRPTVVVAGITLALGVLTVSGLTRHFLRERRLQDRERRLQDIRNESTAAALKEDWEKAIDKILEAQSLDTDAPSIALDINSLGMRICARANEFGKQGDLRAAESLYELAQELPTSHIHSHYGRIVTKRAMYNAVPGDGQRPDPRLLYDAWDICTLGLRLYPDHRKSFLNELGILAKIFGRYDDAIQAYREVVPRAHGQEKSRAFFNLAQVLALNGDLQDAQSNALQSVALDTKPPCATSGKTAEEDWRPAYERSIQLATIVNALGAHQKALESVKATLTCADSDPLAHVVLARIMLQMDPDARDLRSVHDNLVTAQTLHEAREQRVLPINRLLAIQELRQGEYEFALEAAEAARRGGDKPFVNNLLVAIARARLAQRKPASEAEEALRDAERALHHAELLWPENELREPGDYLADAHGTTLWIDTYSELNALREEARAAVEEARGVIRR